MMGCCCKISGFARTFYTYCCLYSGSSAASSKVGKLQSILFAYCNRGDSKSSLPWKVILPSQWIQPNWTVYFITFFNWAAHRWRDWNYEIWLYIWKLQFQYWQRPAPSPHKTFYDSNSAKVLALLLLMVAWTPTLDDEVVCFIWKCAWGGFWFWSVAVAISMRRISIKVYIYTSKIKWRQDGKFLYIGCIGTYIYICIPIYIGILHTAKTWCWNLL